MSATPPSKFHPRDRERLSDGTDVTDEDMRGLLVRGLNSMLDTEFKVGQMMGSFRDLREDVDQIKRAIAPGGAVEHRAAMASMVNYFERKVSAAAKDERDGGRGVLTPEKAMEIFSATLESRETARKAGLYDEGKSDRKKFRRDLAVGIAVTLFATALGMAIGHFEGRATTPAQTQSQQHP